MSALSSPYEGLYESADGAALAWRRRFRGSNTAGALTDWHASTAADGRPLHVARIDCADSASKLIEFVNGSHVQGLTGDQQRPVLDYSVPGRIQCLWLLDGEWIQLWAPDVQAPTVFTPTPGIGLTPAMADRLLAAAVSRPSGRLPFTRRTKSRKENHAA